MFIKAWLCLFKYFYVNHEDKMWILKSLHPRGFIFFIPTVIAPFCCFISFVFCMFFRYGCSGGYAGGRWGECWSNYSFFSLIQYKKPKEILTLEQELLKELKKLKGTGDGNVDCKTQWIVTVGARDKFCIAFKAETHSVIFPVTCEPYFDLL